MKRRTTATAGVAGTGATVCALALKPEGFVSGGSVAGGTGERLRSGVSAPACAALGSITGVGRSDGRSLGSTRAIALLDALGVGEPLGSGEGDGRSLGVGSGDGVMRGTIVATMTGFFRCGAGVPCAASGDGATATFAPSSERVNNFERPAPIARPPITMAIAMGTSGSQGDFAARGRRGGVRRGIFPAVPAARA